MTFGTCERVQVRVIFTAMNRGSAKTFIAARRLSFNSGLRAWSVFAGPGSPGSPECEQPDLARQAVSQISPASPAQTRNSGQCGRSIAYGRSTARRRILVPESEPQLGAHIVTQRRGYTHHGIYVGAGKVVHYAGLAKGLRRGPVEEIPLSRFAAGRSVGVVSGVPAKYHEREVVRRARSRVGEDRYRLLTNNCEHFCEWCLRGQHRSYQIEARLALPVRALLAASRLIAKLLSPTERTGLRSFVNTNPS